MENIDDTIELEGPGESLVHAVDAPLETEHNAGQPACFWIIDKQTDTESMWSAALVRHLTTTGPNVPLKIPHRGRKQAEDVGF